MKSIRATDLVGQWQYARPGVATATVLVMLTTEPAAHAYIDPATGSYVLQLLIAGVVGGLFVAKTFWGNVKSRFRNVFSTSREHPEK